MIDGIIEFSARNRFLVFLFVIAATLAGWWAMRTIPLDAIPDLSDTQVIVYSRWDRSPDIMEDQVTYPIVSAMLGAPRVKDVRGFSDFGYSYVYIIFEDGTDIYWARSRTLEYLSKILPRLPPDVKTEMGPDATGVGCISMRWSATATTWPIYALRKIGFCATNSRPCPEWRKWRRWAVSCANTR
jgi:Cu(I)/Ag(I) efflux system membrane protein CusA/SilA